MEFLIDTCKWRQLNSITKVKQMVQTNQEDISREAGFSNHRSLPLKERADLMDSFLKRYGTVVKWGRWMIRLLTSKTKGTWFFVSYTTNTTSTKKIYKNKDSSGKLFYLMAFLLQGVAGKQEKGYNGQMNRWMGENRTAVSPVLFVSHEDFELFSRNLLL